MVNAEEIEKSIEIGGTAVTKKSAKFGEYNGLDQSTINGGFDIRGGDAYDGQNGTKLWEATGSDLGTTSRSLNGSMSDQGKWKLKIGHDELRHNISDTYQTPQQGSMGGNVFTIPANFGTINSYSGTVNSKDSTRVLNATQLADFHTEKVSSNRYNTSFGSSYIFNENLNLQVDYNHLEQTGAKLIGSSAQGGVTTPTGTDTWKAEAVHILMNPTKYKTDTVDLALNWMTDKGHLTSSYSGSFFRDGYNSLSWQSNLTTNLNGSGACASGGNCTYDNNSMSTAPGNDFHQLNLQGGYNFTPKTKFTAGGSYGRNTQKDGYVATAIAQPNGTIVDTMQLNGLPAANLNGLIIFTNANLLLTNQTTDDLQLSAGIKFNERNNRSPSKTYKYYVLGGVATGQQYTGINNPYSNRKLQTEVAADYRLSKAQKLRLNFENENIKRWCNDVATNAECVDNPRSRENKVGLNYKIRATEDLSFKAGYNGYRR
jgi:MtrB/PioB family decaheme-associated outer membrane protein